MTDPWRSRSTRLLVVFGLVLGLVTTVTASNASAKKVDPVEIRILTVSDWHGQLDPLFVFGEGSFGGAAELSTYFDLERAGNPNSLTLTAGDAVGASPPLSNFFDEEPAVRSMRLMGFDGHCCVGGSGVGRSVHG